LKLKNRKGQPKHRKLNRIAPKSTLWPAEDWGTLGKVILGQFHCKSLPFPVNFGPTRAHESAIWGNASTGLRSTDHHSLPDIYISSPRHNLDPQAGAVSHIRHKIFDRRKSSVSRILL